MQKLIFWCLLVFCSQTSAIYNASYEINNDGNFNLPDGWVKKRFGLKQLETTYPVYYKFCSGRKCVDLKAIKYHVTIFPSQSYEFLNLTKINLQPVTPGEYRLYSDETRCTFSNPALPNVIGFGIMLVEYGKDKNILRYRPIQSFTDFSNIRKIFSTGYKVSSDTYFISINRSSFPGTQGTCRQYWINDKKL